MNSSFSHPLSTKFHRRERKIEKRGRGRERETGPSPEVSIVATCCICLGNVNLEQVFRLPSSLKTLTFLEELLSSFTECLSIVSNALSSCFLRAQAKEHLRLLPAGSGSRRDRPLSATRKAYAAEDREEDASAVLKAIQVENEALQQVFLSHDPELHTSPQQVGALWSRGI